jgi:hypothetical protein
MTGGQSAIGANFTAALRVKTVPPPVGPLGSVATEFNAAGVRATPLSARRDGPPSPTSTATVAADRTPSVGSFATPPWGGPQMAEDRVLMAHATWGPVALTVALKRFEAAFRT